LGAGRSTTTLMIIGTIAELPESDRRRVEECLGKMRDLLTEYEDAGLLALAVVGSQALDDNPL
jgi:hypothetical protein